MRYLGTDEKQVTSVDFNADIAKLVIEIVFSCLPIERPGGQAPMLATKLFGSRQIMFGLILD